MDFSLIKSKIGGPTANEVAENITSALRAQGYAADNRPISHNVSEHDS